MTPDLRKRHRLIWIVLAVILPVLFVLAVLVIPKQPAVQDTLYQAPAKTQSTNPQIDNQ